MKLIFIFLKLKLNFLVLASLLSIAFAAHAQWNLSTTVDLQSRYVWRGQPLGSDGPSVQPGATISYNGFSLGVWGAYNFGISEYQELDWSVSYTFLNEALTLMVTDYSFPILAPSYHYFDYTNNHVFEAGVKFDIPQTQLSIGVYTNFFGADSRNEQGDMIYSTYAELGYTLPWDKQKAAFDFVVGAALNGEEGYSFYGNNGFGVVNVGMGITKELEITPTFKPSCYGQVIANPVANKMFLLCGINIEL